MRILYHHRTRATDAQGVHIREMVQAFREIGHQVEIVSLVNTEGDQDASRDTQESSWKTLVRRIPLAYETLLLGYNLVGLPSLLWKLRGGAGLIYERYSLLNFSGVLAARLSGTPLLLEVNSPFALEQRQENEIRAARFANWMERVICRAATRVVVVSGPLRRILEANGVPRSRMLLMPNGVNPAHLESGGDGAGMRTSLGLGGKVVIGFVGWFRPWHGLEFLIDVFRRAKLGQAGAALLLIGDGPAMPDLQKQVKQHGLEESIVFAGGVSHERIPAYLAAIDIAVQPAANPYCCPMKILEYMGLGKAIAAPRQENIEELVADGQEALLFTAGDADSFGDALRLLVSQPELCRRLGSRARQAIYDRGLLWKRNAERVLQIAASANADRDAALAAHATRD